MSSIKFTVLAPIVGKQRPRFNRRTGLTYTPFNTKQYESAVRAAYISKYPSGQWVTNKEQPISVSMTFHFAMPNSWSRKKKELKEGKSVEQPIYAYITSSRSKETLTVMPSNVIIVEGIMVLTQPELRDLMDVKVYVDADADDRLARILRRDTVERGRSVNDVLEHYYDTVKPMHLQFIEPTKRYADIIVPNIGDNDAAVNLLAKFIHQHINN